MTAFVITGSELFAAASWAARIAPSKPPLPILGGLLIDVAGGEITMTATDFDQWGTVTSAVTTKEPGRLLVAASLLVALAKVANRDVDVAFEDRGGDVQVRCGRSEWTLPKLPLDDFPAAPAATDASCTVNAAALRAAVARVLPAVGRNEALPNLMGIRMEPGEAGQLALATTDRFRMATAELPVTSGEAPTCLVPADLLATACRHQGDGELSLSASGNTFGVGGDDYRLTGRQIAEEFPAWRRFLENLPDEHVVVATAELERVVEHMQVMAPTGEDDTVLLRFADGAVEATATVGERRGRAEAECTVHGELPLAEISLSPGYLRSALAGVGAEHTSVCISPRKMATVRPCTNEGELIAGYTHLVMGRKAPR